MRIAQTSTATACFHNLQATGKTAAQREKVLDFIVEHGGDWSIGELARAMGWEKSTVSRCVNELLYDTDQLQEKHKRKDRVSGIRIRPVGLPEQQCELDFA